MHLSLLTLHFYLKVPHLLHWKISNNVPLNVQNFCETFIYRDAQYRLLIGTATLDESEAEFVIDVEEIIVVSTDQREAELPGLNSKTNIGFCF